MAKYRIYAIIDVQAKNNTDAACVARELLKHSGMIHSVIELPDKAKTVN